MMFMMPTPPTTSEITATASSKLVMTEVVEPRAFEISIQLRMPDATCSPESSSSGKLFGASWAPDGQLSVTAKAT